MFSRYSSNIFFYSRLVLRRNDHQKWTTLERLCSSGVTKVDEQQAHDAMTTSSKRKQNFPFAKGTFIGKFDTDIMTFPEVLDQEKLQTLNEMMIPIEKYFDEKAETLNGLKALGLFGQQIPEEYGGLGLGATEFARIGEVTALDGSIAVTLAAHQSIGLKGLLICGTEEQKRKYLPRLATGEWLAAFCLTEPSSGSDAASIQTRATLSDDGKTWLLNGSKIWISNGGIAEMFTVFAKTEHENDKGEKYDKVTAFIVERGFGGVSSGKPEDKLGIRGSNTCEVYFENTPVPAENVLGEPGQGFKVAMNILNSGRFSMGSSSAGLQYAGINLAETVKKLRNPLMNPGFILKKLLERRKQAKDRPKLTLGLNGFLHPSLEGASRQLEYSVLRLQYAVEILLSRYGNDVMNHQMELKRIADVAIDIYGSTAVLARASRSYCIGLRNAEHELVLATTFCQDALNRIKINIKEIELGSGGTQDVSYKKIADKIFECNGYCAEHPLTRNF
ncbi:hypothetical protein B566_EDAN007955 [Ephemera danica]|nr:hypothetical protein B566_EDAN007955 [Ephemera danica]